MELDPSLSSVQNLTNFINFKNNTNYSSQAFIFDIPEPWNMSENPEDNTKVKLIARNGSGFSGSVDFTYGRIDIDQYQPFLKFEWPDNASFVDQLTTLLIQTGVMVEEIDFDTTSPEFDPVTGEATVILEAKPTSLIYIGETIVLLGAKPAVILRVLEDGTYRFTEDDIPRVLG